MNQIISQEVAKIIFVKFFSQNYLYTQFFIYLFFETISTFDFQN